jgi:hypothetical protein
VERRIATDRPRGGILAGGFLMLVSLIACDPVVSIGGANFPDWLVCLIGGAALSALLRPLLIKLRFERYLRPLSIFYSSLILLFALSAWIVFFNFH